MRRIQLTVMPPLVYVIIVNYNCQHWLGACFETLLATDYPNFKAVLVDNASTDGSAEFVRSRFPRVEVMDNDANYGFSIGNNIGTEAALAAGADYVVLLNSDTKVEPQWLSELISVGEREPGVGILGPVQLRYDGDEDELNTWTTTAARAHLAELREPERARPWIPVEWVEGSCFAVKRRVWEEIGLLDPTYFMFYEEIDFCRRAAYCGYRTGLVPRSRIRHYRGGYWEASPKTKRRRAYHSDHSQFIYTLTEPRRSLAGNFGWYLITLGTKGKEVLSNFSLLRAWDLLRLQFVLLKEVGVLMHKWRRDRLLPRRELIT